MAGAAFGNGCLGGPAMFLFLELYQKRTMVWDLAKADFKKRFVGSYFGVAWMFVQPIVTVLIYFFVFQMGFRSVPPVPDTPYLLWLIPGIVPWFYFSEVSRARIPWTR